MAAKWSYYSSECFRCSVPLDSDERDFKSVDFSFWETIFDPSSINLIKHVIEIIN